MASKGFSVQCEGLWSALRYLKLQREGEDAQEGGRGPDLQCGRDLGVDRTQRSGQPRCAGGAGSSASSKCGHSFAFEIWSFFEERKGSLDL